MVLIETKKSESTLLIEGTLVFHHLKSLTVIAF